eukprot:256002-Rhodomonas_salina.1
MPRSGWRVLVRCLWGPGPVAPGPRARPAADGGGDDRGQHQRAHGAGERPRAHGRADRGAGQGRNEGGPPHTGQDGGPPRAAPERAAAARAERAREPPSPARRHREHEAQRDARVR